jgi:mannan endo-1,4-beta-mannosidase
MRCIIIAAAVLLLGPGSAPAREAGFIQVSGQQFTKDGQPYFFVGTNYWYGMNLASAGPGGDRARLGRELDALAALGVRNLRLMAGSEGPVEAPWRIVPPLQTAPGVYDPAVLDGLDYLIAALRARGLHAVMCLSNFWHWSGGLAQYVSWNGGGPIPYPPPEPGGDWNIFQAYAAQFYSNEGARQDYRDHVAFLLARVNPYTGLSYAQEPAIMAWELANEPRGFHTNAPAFNLWLDENAAYIKSLDPDHLVTTGCEGDTPWPAWNGLDFTANHDGAAIDYATVHIWPQNWGWYDPADAEATYPDAEANARAYLAAHVGAAAALNKPLVLEEFGLARDGGSYDPVASTLWRDSFLSAMFEEVYSVAAGNGPLAGDAFWAWAGEGRPSVPYGDWWAVGDPWCGDPPHEAQGWYSVYDGDVSTLAAVAAHAEAMTALIPATAVEDGSEAGDRGEGSLEIAPSPALGQARIAARLPRGTAAGLLEVFDVQGRRCVQQQITGGEGRLLWPAESLARDRRRAGAYLARLSWPGGAATRKFILLK